MRTDIPNKLNFVQNRQIKAIMKLHYPAIQEVYTF